MLLYAYYFAPKILVFLGFGIFLVNILRVCIIGTFFQMFFMITMLICLYFDFQKHVLVGVTVFFISNTVFTLFTIRLGFDYYGYGYLAACILSSFVMVGMLMHLFSDLHYNTFIRQQVAGQKIVR